MYKSQYRRLMCAARVRGFTLIELMVTVAIVGILAAVGYPSYMQYVVKANRSAVQGYMLGLANQEEQYLLDARRYFCTVDGACSNVLSATTAPSFAVPAEIARSYNVSVAAPDTTGAPTYTISAVPVGTQLARDTQCGTLTLNQAGVKGISGTASTLKSCW